MIYAVKSAIKLLQKHEPKQGYFGCFSGGKDSIVIKKLAEMANVKVIWHYHKTTIDPPELVQFIKREHPEVIFDRPKHGNFFNRMVEVGFPTRLNRWCCREYKEGKFPIDATILMGIRAEESVNRSQRWGRVSLHWKTDNVIINPIYNWDSEEIWDFIKNEKVPYCSLYDENFGRLGCIGCPMARTIGRKKAFERWPQYEKKWRKAFQKIWEKRSGKLDRNGRIWFGNRYFHNWQELYTWWLSDKKLPKPINKGF
ncbi:phosphoadenosine phosphosulfate reductase family protein [candidate division KSB1 bacterium]|nr:phosphoadenosine phosphosulfate reductase family protein [candidate division KSB1 bacterium]